MRQKNSCERANFIKSSFIMEYKYDVALSFAGEDREYVEMVAKVLQGNGVKVFCDKFEEVDLWGKDLGIHFDYIYRRLSKYFIPFISVYYEKKYGRTMRYEQLLRALSKTRKSTYFRFDLMTQNSLESVQL